LDGDAGCLRRSAQRSPSLAVKPQVPGIETNLTIYTTRHIYHLLLHSRGRAMQEVEFYYPDELIASMKDADAAAANAKQEAIDPPGDSDDIVKVAAVDPAQLNFAYTVAGANIPWKPIRAFDDGSHVYVQMPAGMKSSELPRCSSTPAAEPKWSTTGSKVTTTSSTGSSATRSWSPAWAAIRTA
jgi:type IV secretion system protein TrbG